MAKSAVRAIALTLSLLSASVLAAPPIAIPPGVVGMNEDETALIPLATLFSDADGDIASVTAVSNANPAVAGFAVVGPQLQITLVPDLDGVGLVTLRATDGLDNDGTIDSVDNTFLIVVNPVNDAPREQSNPSPVITNEDVDVSIDLSPHIIDPEGDPFTLDVVLLAHPAIDSAVASGLSVDVTLTPDASGLGLLRVEADDGTDASFIDIAVQVLPQNDAPFVDVPPTDIVTNEDIDPTGDVTGVFDDVEGDALTYSVVTWTNPAIQTASMTGDQIDITLVPDASGLGVVTVRADDGNGGTEEVDVNVRVNAVNDAPDVAFVPGPINTDEDVDPSLSLTGVFTDVDGDTLALSVDSWTNPAIQTAVVVGDDLQIVLTEHASGIGTITVEAEDGNGGLTQVDVDITVTAVNDVPFVAAAPLPVVVDEDDNTTLDLLGVFKDADGDTLTLTVTTFTNAALVGPTITGTTLNLDVVPDASAPAP